MKHITRRAFLGGAGAMLALPLMESLIPRAVRAQGMTAPKRFLAYYVPNGMHMRSWTPAAQGPGFELSPILSPLAAVREKLLVISGLANAPARPDGPGDHAAGTGGFLTARHVVKTQGEDIRNGISVDQVIANALAEQTRIGSMQLGIDGGGSVGNCDSGYSCAYARNISWAGPTTPLQKIVNPQVVFDRLFAGLDNNETQAQREKRRRYKASVLDYVLTDARDLKPKLGRTDQRKLDEYMTGVRALEQRISVSMDGPGCEVPDRPPALAELGEHIELMNDLMVAALRCDSTRVISFMLSNAGSGRAYPFLGVQGAHHELSHHQGREENFAALEIIDTWEVTQLASLLEKMDAVEEGDGRTLLDNTVVFFSSEIEDGNSHSHFNLPVLLAGSNEGFFKQGEHLRFSNNEPIADLFVSIIRSCGVDVSDFGDDGTGPLSAIHANA